MILKMQEELRGIILFLRCSVIFPLVIILKNKKTLANNIKKIKKIVEENFDYVGDQFTDEAKKIKYGETKVIGTIII